MRSCALLLALLGACDASTPPTAVMPSLRGVAVVAVSGRPSSDVIDRMGGGGPPDPACVADAYGGVELVADVAPAPGDETVLVSFVRGVMVLGHDGHVIASTPGFACAGSQDELGAAEVVHTIDGDTLIAVVGTRGGKAESATWLKLLSVGASDQLQPRFDGMIERNDLTGTRAGHVTLIPGGLIYRSPTEGTSLWRLDRAAQRYIEWPMVYRRSAHDERPPVVD